MRIGRPGKRQGGKLNVPQAVSLRETDEPHPSDFFQSDGARHTSVCDGRHFFLPFYMLNRNVFGQTHENAQGYVKRLNKLKNPTIMTSKSIKIFLGIILGILLALPIRAFALGTHSADDTESLKEGDIVFQTSNSMQSPIISLATESQWTHCGIVVKKGGELYVLEASNVVKLTPVKKWVERGKSGVYKSKRVVEKPVKIKYGKYLGTKYDTQFKFNNGKYYCSELVYVIYKEQLGIELCKPRQIKEYKLTENVLKEMKRRGIKSMQLAVAPCDLL